MHVGVVAVVDPGPGVHGVESCPGDVDELVPDEVVHEDVPDQVDDLGRALGGQRVLDGDPDARQLRVEPDQPLALACSAQTEHGHPAQLADVGEQPVLHGAT